MLTVWKIKYLQKNQFEILIIFFYTLIFLKDEIVFYHFDLYWSYETIIK